MIPPRRVRDVAPPDRSPNARESPPKRKAFLVVGLGAMGLALFAGRRGTIAARAVEQHSRGEVLTAITTTGPFPAPAIDVTASQGQAKIIVAPPLSEALALGLVVIQYRTENLRIVPVYGAAALAVTPRVGHLHITVDDAPWHWVDASGEPLIIQHLRAGTHRVLIELADPTHRVIDSASVEFEIMPKKPAPG